MKWPSRGALHAVRATRIQDCASQRAMSSFARASRPADSTGGSKANFRPPGPRTAMPRSRTSAVPAATSHGLGPMHMQASSHPSATPTRSMDMAPCILIRYASPYMRPMKALCRGFPAPAPVMPITARDNSRTPDGALAGPGVLAVTQRRPRAGASITPRDDYGDRLPDTGEGTDLGRHWIVPVLASPPVSMPASAMPACVFPTDRRTALRRPPVAVIRVLTSGQGYPVVDH